MVIGNEREVMRARANIQGDRIKGEAEFVEVERDTQRFVWITVRLKGDPTVLTPGVHAMHIHEKEMCEHGDPPFMSAMGHLDWGVFMNQDQQLQCWWKDT